MPVIVLTTNIKAPAGRCFDLARSIDLHKLSTKGTNEKAISGITSGLIGLGEEVTWRATHFGIRQNLTSRITAFEYPIYFRDEMVRGAFKMISHKHEFEQKEAFTVMKDHFEFEIPMGIIGKLFTRLILFNYLVRLLEDRNRIIKRMAESDEWKLFLNK